jgi:phosphoribosylanthranilate isomerase
MWVKICGITNREDALAAIEAGARALGFIFYDRSPRHVAPAQLEPWIGQLPRDVWKVGVFVDESPRKIEQIAEQLSLDVAQLHGAEKPANYPRGLRIWKAVRITGAAGRPSGRLACPDSAEALLLDGPASGLTFDWSLAAGLSTPVILAGGLNPDNVRDAIERARAHPWGVDVSSGVESSPGRKDHARMKKFIEAALLDADLAAVELHS